MAKSKAIRQAGVIPYLEEAGQFMTVLVNARRDAAFWIFPKGHVEDELSPAEAAEKEAYEDAGIRGLVRGKAVGSYSFTKLGRQYKVRLYPMKVKKLLKKWPESSRRKRQVLTFDAAAEQLDDPAMQRLLWKLFARLSGDNEKLTKS